MANENFCPTIDLNLGGVHLTTPPRFTEALRGDNRVTIALRLQKLGTNGLRGRVASLVVEYLRQVAELKSSE